MRHRLAIPLLAILAGAAGAGAMEVKVESDPKVDLRRLHTFAWTECTPAAAEVTHAAIVAAVEAELARKGLTRTAGEADLRVCYHGSATDELEPAELVKSYGAGHFSGAGWYQKPEKRYRKGTLVLQFSDARSGALVWQGTASEAIDPKPEKNTKKAGKAVRKLLESYPTLKP